MANLPYGVVFGRACVPDRPAADVVDALAATANLLPANSSLADLDEACGRFCSEVNGGSPASHGACDACPVPIAAGRSYSVAVRARSRTPAVERRTCRA